MRDSTVNAKGYSEPMIVSLCRIRSDTKVSEEEVIGGNGLKKKLIKEGDVVDLHIENFVGRVVKFGSLL